MHLRRTAPAPVRAQRTRDPGADAGGSAGQALERLTTDRWARLVASLDEASTMIAEGRRQIEELHVIATALHERAKHELEQARLRLAWAEAGLRPSPPMAADPDQP